MTTQPFCGSFGNSASLYMSSLRQHWHSFFALRCIWNEKDELIDTMLGFKPSGTPSASYKSGRFTSANLLRDVVMHEKKKVRNTKGLNAAAFNRAEILVNRKRLEQYKLATDRALSCVGFPSVERLGTTDNSHGSVIDRLDTYLDLSESLSVNEHTRLRQSALKYLDMAEKEAESSFKTFLASEDPTTCLPQRAGQGASAT